MDRSRPQSHGEPGDRGGRLTDRSYWERKQGADRDEPPRFDFFEEIARDLPRAPDLTFFEIGCAPGRMLAKFCRELGYEAHGIDYAADAEGIADYLRRHRVRVGAVHHGDFFSWTPLRTYDIVASFGFIEHFDDPAGALDRHFALVRPGGHVVVGVPNFARGQRLLHWLFDRENLRRHNLACMRLGFFRDGGARNHAEIVKLAYTGGHYDLWRETARSDRLGVKASDPRVWLSPPSAAHLGLRWLAQRRPEAGNPLFSPFIVAIYRAPQAAGRA